MVAAVTHADGRNAPDQYGLAGHPVAHSWSPFIHGMFAKATGENIVYRLYDFLPEEFRREALRLLTSGVRGLNVTVPHKQAAAELVNELTPRAARAQAVNAIALRDDATLLGDNTDGIGLVTDLEHNLGFALADQRVLLLGAGGAVRGVLGPLLERRVREIVIANRTPTRARTLAAEFRDLGAVTACGFADIDGPPFDLVVNGTSASLAGEMPELPPGTVDRHTACYDMAYGRGETTFTRWARAQHASRVEKGWGMLVEQAATAFALWRGKRPDTRPVLAALAPFR
jgi:shikimate dehydrogenase